MTVGVSTPASTPEVKRSEVVKISVVYLIAQISYIILSGVVFHFSIR